jgi:hypothetical protein
MMTMRTQPRPIRTFLQSQVRGPLEVTWGSRVTRGQELGTANTWRTSCPGWPLTTILLISASPVAGVTGVSHHARLTV